MKKIILETIKNKKTSLAVFILILAVGIFLRSYNFSEWLRFNADQSRDAQITSDYVDGKTALPLLGPQAGGTDFRLGGIFYQFQIISTEVFGNDPAKAAYPDLFFSILSIPLFYLLSRIFFDRQISLASTWLFAVSYFIIKYSRFAWNPNSAGFFIMLFLYSAYRIISSEEKKKIWIILAGLALGIIVQLHTSLLIIMPILTVYALFLMARTGKITRTGIAILLAVAVFLNASQIISEIKSHGNNTKEFFLGAANKNRKNSSIAENVALNIACHINANAHIAASFGDEEDCGYSGTAERLKRLDGKKMAWPQKISFVAVLSFSLVFSLAGYYLILLNFKREKDESKKMFAKIFLVYIGLVFIFFMAWANELSIRFFLPVGFVSPLIAGFFLEFFWEKFPWKKAVFFGLIILFTSFNFQKISAVFHDLQYGGREINGRFEYITFGEADKIARFMKDNSGGEKEIYINAPPLYLFKSLNSIDMMAKRYGLKIADSGKQIALNPGDTIFYLRSSESRCELEQKMLTKYDIKKCESYRQFSIFALIAK